MAREQFKNLTEPMYYILLSLYEERHGYEIMQYIEGFTAGRVIVGAGTLYNLLSRFQKEGIIALISDDGRKKTYKLTIDGEGFLKEEHERLKTQISDGDNILSAKENKDNKVDKETIIRMEQIRIKKDEDLFF